MWCFFVASWIIYLCHLWGRQNDHFYYLSNHREEESFPVQRLSRQNPNQQSSSLPPLASVSLTLREREGERCAGVNGSRDRAGVRAAWIIDEKACIKYKAEQGEAGPGQAIASEPARRRAAAPRPALRSAPGPHRTRGGRAAPRKRHRARTEASPAPAKPHTEPPTQTHPEPLFPNYPSAARKPGAAFRPLRAPDRGALARPPSARVRRAPPADRPAPAASPRPPGPAGPSARRAAPSRPAGPGSDVPGGQCRGRAPPSTAPAGAGQCGAAGGVASLRSHPPSGLIESYIKNFSSEREREKERAYVRERGWEGGGREGGREEGKHRRFLPSLKQ